MTKNGPPSVIEIHEMADLIPGHEEVIIKTSFAGVNFADCLMRLGIYRPKPKPPFTPGYELSGTISAIGTHVKGLEIGQRVVAATPDGAQASHALVREKRCFPVPDHISLETAAAIPVTYLTAWHMLIHLGNLQANDSVLIHGAAGGVGTAAIQICRMYGVERIFGTASASKRDAVTGFGVHFIDRHNENFVDVVREHTDRDGVDHILDPIGGDHLRQSLSVLAHGGRLYAFGLAAAAPTAKFNPLKSLRALRRMPKLRPLTMMSRNQGVFGVHIGTFAREAILRSHMKNILECVESGEFDPVIDSIIPLDNAVEAHQRMHDGLNIGKILLKP
ncbi:MAG TPA: zinc-binding dehydrogenase [Candidatus Poseidoniales archaeon]|nr:zinc-binding dehydrogenase [Candidatus Poseidoniales archaeon]